MKMREMLLSIVLASIVIVPLFGVTGLNSDKSRGD